MNDNRTSRTTPQILVADDDPAVRMVLRSALEEAGFSVVEAADGKDALEAFTAHRPDLALLDVVMPGMDGYEVCAAIRRQPAGERTPVLMLTALDDIDSINRAYDAGATDFAVKPVSWLVLTHRVRYMLRAKEAADALQCSEARLAAAQRIARLGHWEWDVATNRFHGSPEVLRLLATDPESLERLEQFLACVHPEDRSGVARLLDEVLRHGRADSLDHRVVLLDGTERYMHLQAEPSPDADGRPTQMSGTIQDITERIQTEERIRFLAHYDGLTGLPNRILFNERLNFALHGARRKKGSLATLFLDLDQFKRVNETLGHTFGDRLLKAFAERLRNLVRASDLITRHDPSGNGPTLARLGGDEFILLLGEISRGEDAARVARRILDSLAVPFRLDERDVFISASIGISLFPLDGDDAETLLKNADAAMYHAKDSGRNNYQFYNDSMNAAAFQRLSMETGLRRALERDEFLLYYQPQVDVEQNRIIGVEALVRWRHPDMGMVSPAEFIPLAEETGLILPLGEWVLKTACAQGRAWEAAGLGDLRIAVNLSAHQFQQPPAILKDAILNTGCEPERVELEITESVLMGDAQIAMQTLEEFKALGIRIAIDDFGTGYSSLNYLKRFRIDALKIDRSFVHDVNHSPDDAAITAAIISMARSLKIEAVAEGVETPEQRDFLRRRGCRIMQGYLFGRPAPAEDVTKLLEQQKAAEETPVSVA